MIYAKIEKFNKDNFELLTNGEWFERAELYTLLNALCEYNDWCLKHNCLSGEREIYHDMIRQKLLNLISEDSKKKD